MYCLKRNVNSANHKFINFILQRCASSGLGLWDVTIDNELRLKIEKYWQDKILNNKSRQDEEHKNEKEKYYVLSMFPYPSGSLHMGHVRVYSISDTVARFHRMKGRHVVHPMGWDAFGLPAENAALERKINAAEWTEKNISNMKAQLNLMGCDFDWERELATCNPNYYRWTQELFLKLYKRGLAYQSEAFVNWDPIDQTVLADEQVNHDGKSWRSGAKVEKKLLKQWFIKTTAFAKELYDGLDDKILKEWRDIKKIQRHWIGECTGTTIDFKLLCDIDNYPTTLTLWTDKPELIEHAKFVAVSKDNFLVKAQNDKCYDVESRYLNAKVINPFNNEELPIYFTKSIQFPRLRDNYLGIPCANEIDAEFSENVGIKYDKIAEFSDEEKKRKRDEVMKKAREEKIGGYPVSVSLRDWLISRQRYWGTPIPIIHCKNCGARPVPEKDLPVILPSKSSADNDGIPNLRQAIDWLKTSCPDCGEDAVREADTMDTFVDSSWYFMRYIDSKNTKEMFSKDKAAKYLPVDLYIGGKEHAALHLYYSRFVSYFLHSEGLLPTKEPFKQLLVQGMVNGLSFRVKNSGKYLKKDEVEMKGKVYVEKATGNSVVATWEKMSKSKFNGVDPMEMFSEYGPDTTRLIILADVAPISSRNWSTQTFPGILNWQQRLWLTIRYFLDRRKQNNQLEELDDSFNEKLKDDDAYMYDSRNYYIKGVTFNIIGSQQLSVAISKMQGLTNSLRKVSVKCLTHSREYERALATQIIMLAPFAPRFASELWAGFCSAPYHLIDDDECIQRDKDVLEQIWPTVDMDYKLELDVNKTELVSIKVPRRILDNLSADTAAQMSMDNDEFKKFVGNKQIIDYKFIKAPDCDAKIYFQVMSQASNLKIENTA
ncbi:hypothetical protein PV326_007021 [Microctonus aethiopoides]|nr:hypothetical protein PV326_007021 [Microctonus aethiopoides]